MVEAIRQILTTHSEAKILACTPSNSATDHLCQKIVDAVSLTVYRFYSLSFPVKKMLHLAGVRYLLLSVVTLNRFPDNDSIRNVFDFESEVKI